MEYDEHALQNVRQNRLLIDQYDAWLFDQIRPYLGQRILEIGCGLGNMLRHISDREVVVGVETSQETVLETQRQFAGYPNVTVIQKSITDPAVLELQDYRFDTAFSLNVFEHIEDDMLALAHTSQLLVPNGSLILIIPAHGWLYGTMDRSIGHYRRYTKDMLSAKLSQNGFIVVHQAYVNMLGALGWFVNGRILHRPVPPSGQLKLFNSLVPLIRRFETVFRPPFGISLLSISTRVTAS